jgi:phosphohistidine phosphatase
MAKTLWLLRHAHAVNNPPPGGRDRDRRLSPRGTAQVTALRALLDAGHFAEPLPVLTVASPAARTRATAEGVFAGCLPDAAVATDRRLYQATPDEVLDIIREIPDDFGSVAIVGHNPTIHCLVLDLLVTGRLEGPTAPSASYPPASLSILRFDVDSWTAVAWATGELVALEVPPAG